METRLRNDFTAHYGLSISTTPDISLTTNATYFEIEDDDHKETQLHFTVGSGMVAYKNSPRYEVEIINYDKFFTGLPHAFQQGKDRCDLIVYTKSVPKYFLLNELKDRIPTPKVRRKAKKQLLVSLQNIRAVPSISSFIDTYAVKRCCYCNKKSIAPPIINATSAFNRINSIASNGLRMSNPDIEALGFEFYEYSGGSTFVLA